MPTRLAQWIVPRTGRALLCAGTVAALTAGPVAAQPPAEAKPADPAEPGPRLRLLALPPGLTPKANPKVDERFGRYVHSFVDPEKTLDLVVGRTRLMRLKDGPKRVQLTDAETATSTVVSPTELSLAGKKVGTTVLTLWFADARNPAAEEVISYLVRVIPDPESKERTDRVYKALADEINEAFPDSNVKLRLVGDKVVVTGNAKDVQEAFQILRVAAANAPQRGAAVTAIPVGQLNVTLPAGGGGDEPTDAEAADQSGIERFLLGGGRNVINHLRVGGQQQVMLKVTVAEVNRSAARSVGINFSVNTGNFSLAQLTGNIAQNLSANGATLNNLPVSFDGGRVAIAVNALRTLNLARSLAEPNLVTLNGKPATFRAGGSFPVPVVTGATSVGLQGVQFIPFGVSLQFTPVITDRDRVRLQVGATVSTRDTSSAQTNINGAGITSLNERTFQTTVELRDGQTLAVAGLIQNNLGSDASRIPFLGDLPYAGRLFAFDRTSYGDQELVVLITPELAHPMEKGDVPPLPGSDMFCPTDVEFYLKARLLGHGGVGVVQAAACSPAEVQKVNRVERKLLVGPSGYSTHPAKP